MFMFDARINNQTIKIRITSYISIYFYLSNTQDPNIVMCTILSKHYL